MKPVILALLLLAVSGEPQNRQRFTGTITDNMCPAGDHSRMRMGANDAECTIACNDSHGAVYILYDGKVTYGLSDQKTPEKFAGKKVNVSGTLDTKTQMIRVDSITAAN